MATKKQKRQRALEARAQFLATVQETGQQALQRDREHRRRQELADWQNNHDKNHIEGKCITECPHCRIEMKALQTSESGQLSPATS